MKGQLLNGTNTAFLALQGVRWQMTSEFINQKRGRDEVSR